MPPDATDNAADNKPNPDSSPSEKEEEQVERQLPPNVQERMRRVSPDMARRYRQRPGQ